MTSQKVIVICVAFIALMVSAKMVTAVRFSAEKESAEIESAATRELLQYDVADFITDQEEELDQIYAEDEDLKKEKKENEERRKAAEKAKKGENGENSGRANVITSMPLAIVMTVAVLFQL